MTRYTTVDDITPSPEGPGKQATQEAGGDRWLLPPGRVCDQPETASCLWSSYLPILLMLCTSAIAGQCSSDRFFSPCAPAPRLVRPLVHSSNIGPSAASLIPSAIGFRSCHQEGAPCRPPTTSVLGNMLIKINHRSLLDSRHRRRFHRRLSIKYIISCSCS